MLHHYSGLFLCLCVNLRVVIVVDSSKFIDFLKDVKRYNYFDNILMMKNQNSSIAGAFTCDESKLLFRDIMEELQVPVVLRNETDSCYLNQYLSKNLLVIVYIDGTWSQHDGLLKNLVLNLSQMTTSNILFLFNLDYVNMELLNSLFRWCWIVKIINVVALFANFQKSNRFYSYTHFPEFMLESKMIAKNETIKEIIFPYRLDNLKGFKLKCILGGSEPRLIVYTKRNGEVVVAGFVGHFVQAFAKKYNVRIVQPLPLQAGVLRPAHTLIEAVQNNTVDISAAITYPNIPFIGFSYPYEIVNSCIMLPMEPEVPHYEFYARVFEVDAIAIIFLIIVLMSMLLSRAHNRAGRKQDFLNNFIHFDCLRGILGQSFLETSKPTFVVRFIHMQMCFLGILLTTWFNSYYSTYITSAQKQPLIRSLNDIQASGLKIYIFEREYVEYAGRAEEFLKYSYIFHQEKDYKKYLSVRDSLSTEFAYILPTTKWNIFKEQQKLFTKPIFRKSEDLCLFNNIPLCFPVHNNSIYKEPLLQLMLETAQSGLTNYWRENGFMELVIAGKLHFTDLSKSRVFKAMVVEDLKYIWIGMGSMVVLALHVFLAELYIFNRYKIHHQMKAFWKKLLNRY